MVKRQRGSAVYAQFKGIGVERRSSPTSKNAPGIYRGTACQVAKLGMTERIRQWKM